MKCLLYILLAVLLFGCYTRRKAEKQIGLAAATFPDILAKKARDLFPCVTSHGDTIYVSDSAAYMEALNALQDDNFKLYEYQDSLMKQIEKLQKDTVCFDIIQLYTQIIGKQKQDYLDLENKCKHLPPVIKYITIKDTVLDKAALAACDFDKSSLILQLEKKTSESDEWKKKAKNRFWWIIIMGAIIGVGTYIKVAGIFRPKLKAVP